jgi:eukaryotic translation initiation factor 2C
MLIEPIAIMATNVLLRDLPSKKFAQVGSTGNRFFTMDGASDLPQGGVVCKGFMQ